MAGQNYTWQVSSPNIGTGVGVISSAYNVDDKSPFTTITATNQTGYINVFPNSSSTDLNIKNLQYAVQTDGKITYRVLDGTQQPRQYNSLQELADGRGNWSASTTEQVKTQMNGILTTSAQSKSITPTSPTPSTGDAAAAPIDEKKAQENLDKLKISDDPRTRLVSEYPDNLKYPLDMDGKQDCIRFTMLQYAPRQINVAGISQGDPLSERSTTQNRTRGKTVILPIQPTISDNNVVKWGSSEMNAGQLIAASAALATITEGEQGAIASIKQITDLFKGSASDLKTVFAAGFADAAAGTKGLLTRVTGGIVNPNMELLFEGPDLRTFNFNFSLSAREPTEAKVIRNIIRFFKQGMSVKTSNVGLFLKSPHTFEIKYFHEGAEHPWINKIKECALTSCNVNYTPAGNYATYEDGAMTQYDITLSFSELEPIYDYEYGKGSTTYDSEIGF